MNMKLSKSVRNLRATGTFVGGAILVYFLIQYGFQGFTEVLQNVKPQLDRHVAGNQVAAKSGAEIKPGTPESAQAMALPYLINRFVVVAQQK